MTTVDRINELLKRAGQPMMVVLNEENHGPKPAAYRTMAEAIDAYIKEQQRKDNNLIEILVAVLENVLNERDEAIRILRDELDGCEGCMHGQVDPEDEPCVSCYRMWDYEDQNNWTWGGVPDQEDAHEDT